MQMAEGRLLFVRSCQHPPLVKHFCIVGQNNEAPFSREPIAYGWHQTCGAWVSLVPTPTTGINTVDLVSVSEDAVDAKAQRLLRCRRVPVKNDRLQIPVDRAYAQAVGVTVICFARLQTVAISCCEALLLGYGQSAHLKSAGTVAADLVALSLVTSEKLLPSDFRTAAQEFMRLTLRRNALLHAAAAPAPYGEQRLFRSGAQWTVTIVNDLADEFVAAEKALRHCLNAMC